MRRAIRLAIAIAMTAGAMLSGSAAMAVPAYVIAEIVVKDPAKFQQYATQSMATAKAFGGVYRVRGGNGEAVEGAPPAARVVVIEFPSRAAAEGWHASPAYQAILPLRLESTTSRMFIVDGVEP